MIDRYRTTARFKDAHRLEMDIASNLPFVLTRFLRIINRPTNSHEPFFTYPLEKWLDKRHSNLHDDDNFEVLEEGMGQVSTGFKTVSSVWEGRRGGRGGKCEEFGRNRREELSRQPQWYVHPRGTSWTEHPVIDHCCRCLQTGADSMPSVSSMFLPSNLFSFAKVSLRFEKKEEENASFNLSRDS